MQENYIKNLFYEFSILDSNSFIKFKEAISILIRNDRMNDLNSIIEKCTYEQILSSNPNIPKEKLLNLANSISSILKAYIHKVFLKILHSKVMEFESEEEAQELFKKIYHKELDKANKNLYPQEIIDLIYEYYDLCKYDKKLII